MIPSTLGLLYTGKSIVTDNQLSQREKWADSFRLAVTTGASIASGYGGAEIGASVGLVGGPVGVGIGIFFGGLIGAVAGSLIGRSIERKPLSLEIEWIGKYHPRLIIDYIKDKARYLYISGIADIPNLKDKEEVWFIEWDLGNGDKDKIVFSEDSFNKRPSKQIFKVLLHLYETNPNFSTTS
jgi:hypothetical protein